MRSRYKILAAVGALLLGLSPLLLQAHKNGPDQRHTGAPGDDPQACANSQCHVGTPLNGGGGNVVVQFQNGLSYVPGVKQTLTIVITDSAARDYGFQMTARLNSDLANGQAGDFTAGAQQLVLCDDGSEKQGNRCPSPVPVQFIEHSAPFLTNTISVDWTPPATDVGPITIYVAANAGDGKLTDTGDHIYTAQYTLNPFVCTASKPVIANKGVVNGGSFVNSIQTGSWVTILGSNLSTTTRVWDSRTEIVNGKLPASLDGVSVAINDKSASVYFVSPNQINVQAPDDDKQGPVNVVVTNCSAASDPMIAQLEKYSPALFLFDPQNRQYPAALIARSDGGVDYLGPSGLFGTALATRPVKPGERILLFGTGFGPTDPIVPAGEVYSSAAPLTDLSILKVTIGGVAAAVEFAGVTGAGLYQLNLIVPNSLPDGDQKVVASIGSQSTQANVFVAVHK